MDSQSAAGGGTIKNGIRQPCFHIPPFFSLQSSHFSSMNGGILLTNKGLFKYALAGNNVCDLNSQT